LIDPASLDERALQVLNRVRAHHDIAACLLADALELAPPPPGRYLASLAGQRRWLLRKSADDPTDWLSPVQACREEARLLLRRKGVRARVVAAQDDPVRALRALLQGGPDQSAGAA
jgi:hypothetical protein